MFRSMPLFGFALIFVILSVVACNNVFAQTPNATNPANQQKPTEQKQGGEYSGFENNGKQPQGVPNTDANPIPQAPISGANVKSDNGTTNTAANAIMLQQSPIGIGMLVGMGGAAAAAIVAGAWYFRKKRGHQAG